MICPECGTRLPEGKTECHFCGYKFTTNEGNNQSYDSFRLSMLSIMIASVALILTAANASIDSEFPRVSITIGNQTVTQPLLIPGTQLPLIFGLHLVYGVLILGAIGITLFLTDKSRRRPPKIV
jgi:hypothetical protein